MKKIGIVTFHQALNYGAKLQAYALQQFLEKNGIENDVIDYTCHFMYTRNIRPIRVGKHHKLKSFIRSLITMRQVGIVTVEVPSVSAYTQSVIICELIV